MKDFAKWVGLAIGALVLYAITQEMTEVSRWGIGILVLNGWIFYQLLKRFDGLTAQIQSLSNQVHERLRQE